MGLKSKEIEHLLIRRLKPTANGPVTIPALLMTDGLLLNSSNLSKSEYLPYLPFLIASEEGASLKILRTFF